MIKQFYFNLSKTLFGATTSSQTNGNEMMLHIPQNPTAKASPSDGLMWNPGHKSRKRVLPPRRDVVCVFYSLRRLGLDNSVSIIKLYDQFVVEVQNWTRLIKLSCDLFFYFVKAEFYINDDNL